MFLNSLHCTFMLNTQRGCLNSRLTLRIANYIQLLAFLQHDSSLNCVLEFSSSLTVNKSCHHYEQDRLLNAVKWNNHRICWESGDRDTTDTVHALTDLILPFDYLHKKNVSHFQVKLGDFIHNSVIFVSTNPRKVRHSFTVIAA